MNTIGCVEALAQDVRYTFRTLGRNPGFALVAALSLALGIGANTAIYSILNAVMLRMLPVPDPDGKPQAPHILIAVFGRGMLLHLYTRIYFYGEADNAADPVLALVPSDRRATLIAVREPGNGNAVYRFDINLQGDNETVFFDV